MTFKLSDYQIAALQEMNITVWRKAGDEQKEADDAVAARNSKPSADTNQTARSRIEQLKAHIQTPSENNPVASSVESPLEVPATKAPKPLDTNRFKSFFDDLNIALAAVLDDIETTVVIADCIKVEKHQVTLPATPDKLSSADKKALWSGISRLV